MDIGEQFSHTHLMRTLSFKLGQYLAEVIRLILSSGHTRSIRPQIYHFYQAANIQVLSSRGHKVLLSGGHTSFIKPRTYEFY